jgi:hypothetical protein
VTVQIHSGCLLEHSDEWTPDKNTNLPKQLHQHLDCSNKKNSVIASKMLGIILFIFFLSSQPDWNKKKPENLRKMQLSSQPRFNILKETFSILKPHRFHGTINRQKHL